MSLLNVIKIIGKIIWIMLVAVVLILLTPFVIG